MNKRICLLLIIFNLICANIKAEQFKDIFDFSLNVITLKFQYNFLTEKNNFEFRYGFADFILEHKKLHFGLKYEVVSGSITFHKEPENNKAEIYFLNPAVFWNVLFNDKFVLGPFLSFNYLTLTNLITFGNEGKSKIKFSAKDYIFDMGLVFMLKKSEYRFFPYLLGLEFGYRITNEMNNLFVNVVFKGNAF